MFPETESIRSPAQYTWRMPEPLRTASGNKGNRSHSAVHMLGPFISPFLGAILPTISPAHIEV